MYVLIFLNNLINKCAPVEKSLLEDYSHLFFFVKPANLYLFNLGFALWIDIYFFKERIISETNKFFAALLLNEAKIWKSLEKKLLTWLVKQIIGIFADFASIYKTLSWVLSKNKAIIAFGFFFDYKPLNLTFWL